MAARPFADRLKEFEGQEGCWNWPTKPMNTGYGLSYVRQPDGSLRKANTHRLAYEMLVGPVPAGMHLDHLCSNRRCCNPAHLEVVTPRENIMRGVGPSAQNARKTHCSLGHALDMANTYITPSGERTCRECRREAARRYKARKRRAA